MRTHSWQKVREDRERRDYGLAFGSHMTCDWGCILADLPLKWLGTAVHVLVSLAKCERRAVATFMT